MQSAGEPHGQSQHTLLATRLRWRSDRRETVSSWRVARVRAGAESHGNGERTDADVRVQLRRPLALQRTVQMCTAWLGGSETCPRSTTRISKG